MAENNANSVTDDTKPEDDYDSFEAADAVPVAEDELDDETSGRRAINLDAALDLNSEIEALSRPRRRPASAPSAAPSVAPADAPPVVNVIAPTPDDAVDEMPEPAAVSSEEVENLKAQLSQVNNDKLRALADLQNVTRRSREEMQRTIRDGNEKLIKELLPVLDDFDLALNAARQTESYEQLIGGVSAILRKFNDTLVKQGVEPIAALEEKFDPDMHEAVMLDEESDAEDETITGELRKGYLMNGRVIRPSLVKVAKHG